MENKKLIEFTCPYTSCAAELSIYARNVIEGAVGACHKCNQRHIFRSGYLERWPADDQLEARGFTCHECGNSFMYRSLATRPNRNGTQPSEMVPEFCPDCGEEISDATAFDAREATAAYQRNLQAPCSVCGCKMSACVHDDCSGCGGKEGFINLNGFAIKGEHYEAIRHLSNVFFGQTPADMPEKQARKIATGWAIRSFEGFRTIA